MGAIAAGWSTMTLGTLASAPQDRAMQSVMLTVAVATFAVASAAAVVAVPQACIAQAAAPELALGCKCDQASRRLS